MIDATVTLVDSGLFTELAVRLAREVSHVRSHVPWFTEFPTINDRLIGNGLPEVEWVEDPYLTEVVDTTDVYVFPDILRAGEQDLISRLGKPVWGSRTGDELETRRMWFREIQKQLGMPLPEYEIVQGWTNLCAFLKDKKRCFIKTTCKIRGTMETHEFFDFDQDRYWLWDLRLKLGPAAEHVFFMVEEPIESGFETGLDTYCIEGKFPKTPMQGVEIKGKLMLSSAQIDSPTPKAMDDALTLLAPLLKERCYCNFLSAEFRGDILTDFCARAPNPGLGVEMEMIKNIGEIIVQGANGCLIQPEYEFEYGLQAAIFHDHPEELPKIFKLDNDLRRWVKLMEFCQLGDEHHIVPRPPHGKKIGWVIGVGHSIQDAIDHLQVNADALKEYPFDIATDAVAEALAQVQTMEAQGLEFSDQQIPDPESVATEQT